MVRYNKDLYRASETVFCLDILQQIKTPHCVSQGSREVMKEAMVDLS